MYYATTLLLSLAMLLTPKITATPIPDTSTPTLHPREYVRTFHFCDDIGYKGHCEGDSQPPISNPHSPLT
ncbi:hypothetical protein E2P81_ATG03211 [Venturia nashicola]|nr:hypothetical protein E2P81_ATG03211 [Venturia nashicola]